MKIRALFTVGVILLSTLVCKNSSAQEKFSEEKIKAMLNSFYTDYIKANSDLDRKKSDLIVKQYCTTKLINYVNKLYSEPPGKVNADIFLKSQMVDTRMLEHLEFGKDPLKNDLYYVYLRYGMWRWTVKLSVAKEKDELKIDHVFITGVDE